MEKVVKGMDWSWPKLGPSVAIYVTYYLPPLNLFLPLSAITTS